MNDNRPPSLSLLLVEDEPSLRRLLRRHLEDQGYAVTSAESGQEALDLVRGGLRPTAIILDVTLGDMSGRDLAGKLREQLAQSPILFVSGYSSDIVDRYIRNDPRSAFLQKPFTVEEMEGSLKALLQ